VRVPRRPDQDTFDAVDAFVESTLFALPDPALEAAQADADAAGLPQIQVTPAQSRLLEILIRAIGAQRILEFGTLAGYSTIAMARCLPEEGLLTTLEFDPAHAEVAWTNIERAGVADLVDLRVGAALETLPLLASEGCGPFDFVFIDADKTGYAGYFDAVLPMLSDRGLIAVDNTLWSGRILDPNDTSPDTVALRQFNDDLARDQRVVVVQTPVRDGVTLVRRAG
jgi:predicted O-methyltransferase YrrM